MAATAQTLRRAARLSNYRGYSGYTDTQLQLLVEDALSVFLDYTHRSEDPGEAIDPIICDIARTRANREGQEGVKKAKDGEMEREWSDATGELDQSLVRRMKPYRLVVGVNASPQL